MLTIQNVYKKLNKKVILENVNLQIMNGEKVALIGKNGAGKTTLFKTIVGLLKPDQGHVYLEGNDLYTKPEFRKNIGYVPVDSFFYENLTVQENLELISKLFGIPMSVTYLHEIAKQTQIDMFLDKKINELSSGMKKKVSLVAATIHNPDVIIMDEPFNALDIAAHHLFYNIMRNHKGPILFTSHLPETIYELANKIYIIKDGKIEEVFTDIKSFQTLTHFTEWYLQQIQA